MRKIVFILFALIMFGASTGWASPGIIAAKFHADWCASCEAIAPVHEEMIKKYSEEDVLFVTLNKTDNASSHQAELMAHALGMEEAFYANDKTGFVLLIDGISKEVMGKLTKGHSAQKMSEILDRVLAGEDALEELQDVANEQIKADSVEKK